MLIDQLGIFLLGPPLITRARQPLNFAYSRARVLLAYLALEADRPHSREALAMLFWPDLPDAAARTNLRQVLANLRITIGDDASTSPVLLVSREAVQFNRAANYQLDVTELQQLLDTCSSHTHRDIRRCRSCAHRLARASELYRGDFLAGVTLDDSTPLAEWQIVLRERLHQRMLEAFAQLLAYHSHVGNAEQAIAYARRLLDQEPWHEETHRDLMQLLASTGQRSLALAQYEACRKALDDAFGVQPSAETNELLAAIRADAGMPSLQSNSALPIADTSFVGRNAECEALRTMLENPAHRLITIVGPGGSGKTRLALQAAHDVGSSFQDGVAFVALDGLIAHEQIASTILAALEVPAQGRKPPEEQLFDYLRERELLLVLDNFEHVLAGADLVGRMLRDAANITVLATSRERLALRAEWLFDLAGLSFPINQADGSLETYDAVQLFVERARQVQRQFNLEHIAEAVAQICQLVEGLPLALELAATTIRERSCAETATAISLGIAALAADTRDIPARQRSIRATFDYSWQLLSAEEQRTMRQLSVFRGGFTTSSATEVAQATSPLLDALVAKSLLRHSLTDRFAMHELVRQYAAEQLELAGQTGMLQQRHHEAFLALAQAAEPQLTGAEQTTWLQLLETEHDNLRAALHWALSQGLREQAGLLSGALWRFWWTRDYLEEGQHWLEQVVGNNSALPALPIDVLVQVLKGQGALASRQGDFERAAAVFRRELELRVQIGSQSEIASVLVNLATALQQQGEYQQAIDLLEQSIAIDRALEDWSGLAYDLGALGQIAYHQGAYHRAHELLLESLVLHRQRGDTYSLAVTLVNLCSVASERGNIEELERFGAEALQLYRDVNNRHGIAVALENLVDGRLHHGDFTQACEMITESLHLYRQLGARDDMLSALGTVATVVAKYGQLEQAVQLLGAVAVLYEADGIPLRAFERTNRDEMLKAAHQQLGSSVVAAATAAGAAWSLEEAVQHAFAMLASLEADSK